MRRFVDLFTALDQTTRSSEKTAALADYFRTAPPACAAWALHILSGRRLIRAINGRLLGTWLSEETGYPGWLIGECYEAVGDFSETIALLLPEREDGGTALPLREVIERRILPLPHLDEAGQRSLIVQTWREFDRAQRFLFHKLISGSFRVGAAARLVANALAEVAAVPAATMAHRLMGRWSPTAEDFQRLIAAQDERADDPTRPYPFYLASPLESEPRELGPRVEWLAEWKWDGIRAQIIRRGGQTVIWSRGEEIINGGFPELVQAAARLPDGAVIDGEVLAWEGGRALPFAVLQRRINRKRVELSLWPDVPVVFMAFDLLERSGMDIRAMPLDERRAALRQLIEPLQAAGQPVVISPPVEEPAAAADAAEWQGLAAARSTARDRNAEGVMLKRRSSPYGVGRQRGDWWKWKVSPYTLDAVLIYAQRGSGRRASLLTDYTFGVWDDGELVPIAKAYSGLSDEEIRQVDAFCRKNTIERHGPIRMIAPLLVFELAFEGIQRSTRHRAGIALRFPRMNRWRHDKTAAEADSLETAAAMLRAAELQGGIREAVGKRSRAPAPAAADRAPGSADRAPPPGRSGAPRPQRRGRR